MVAIIVNFINLHSDYEEVHEFYIGFMGRKMLIQERRLTSRQSYEIKLPSRTILESKILEIFSVEYFRQVGCYDVAKFRFVNSRQLSFNAQLSIVTNLNFSTS